MAREGGDGASLLRSEGRWGKDEADGWGGRDDGLREKDGGLGGEI